MRRPPGVFTGRSAMRLRHSAIVSEEALADNATEWAEVMRVAINNMHEDDWAEILSSIRRELGLAGGPEDGERTGVDRLDLTRLIASVLGIPAAAIVVTDL